MELPQLPKLRKHKEADKTPAIMDWFFNNYPDDVAVEVKIKGNKVKPHQEIALKQVHTGKFKLKLADMGRINPFDFIVLKKAKAFTVIVDGHDCIAYSVDMKERFIFRI